MRRYTFTLKKIIFLSLFLLANNFILYSQENELDFETLNEESTQNTNEENESSYSSDNIDLDALLEGDDVDLGGASVVEVEEITDNELASEIEEGVSFSGNISVYSGYTMHRDWFEASSNFKQNRFYGRVESAVFFDARLKGGFKAFANFSLSYDPRGKEEYKTYSEISVERSNSNITTNITISGIGTVSGYLNAPTQTIETNYHTFVETNKLFITLKELFLDINIKKRLYLRFGKQTLQWGRGYLWNPTDLINIEKKDFFNMDSAREGTYGLKMHVPVKTMLNFYAFLNTGSSFNVDEIALAGKIEALIVNTEVSISAWWQKDYKPVFGFDFSSRIPGINIDLRGEISFSYGGNTTKIKKTEEEYISTFYITSPSNPFIPSSISLTNTVTNVEFYEEEEKIIPKLSFGFGRSFDIGAVEDRLTINFEYFFNHEGYKDDIFEDEVLKNYIMQVYTPREHGRHYGAVFVSVADFIASDLTLSLNAIGNFSDLSFVITGGLSYMPRYNLTIGLSVVGYAGKELREFTLSGNTLSLEFSSKLTF